MGKLNPKIVPSGLIQVWKWQDTNRRRFTGDNVSKSIHDFLAYASTLPLNLKTVTPYKSHDGQNEPPVALKQVWEWKDYCYESVASLSPTEAIHTLLENARHVAEAKTEYKKRLRNSNK